MKQETIFYSRTETENEVMIKWKPYTTYGSFLYIILAVVFSQIFSKTFNSILMILAMISFIMMIVNTVISIIATKKITNEARMAQQKGNCRLEGNKYSLSNPLVIHIYK